MNGDRDPFTQTRKLLEDALTSIPTPPQQTPSEELELIVAQAVSADLARRWKNFRTSVWGYLTGIATVGAILASGIKIWEFLRALSAVNPN